MDVAVDPSGGVHAEERERRIGDRIHEAAHQVGGRRAHVGVLAAERDDPHLRIGPRGLRQFVAPEPGARDGLAGEQFAPRTAHDDVVAAPVEGVDRMAGQDVDARVAEQLAELSR